MTRKTWILIAAFLALGPTSVATPRPAEAGTRVGVSVAYGSHGYSRHPRHLSPRVRAWYPYWHWGISVGYPAYGWGGWYGYPVAYPVAVRSGRLGAVDVNVKPKKAEVYLDGEYVGTARQFDGYPNYLWLEPGRYELAFFREGYRTEVREVQVRTGAVIDLRLRLAEGLAERPSGPVVRTTPPPRTPSRTARRPAEVRPQSAPPAIAPDSRDLRAEPIRLHLRVKPADASVYLDGRLLGSADELDALHAGLLVEAGGHTLEVVRPGYEAERLEFEAEPGEEIELVVTLEGP